MRLCKQDYVISEEPPQGNNCRRIDVQLKEEVESLKFLLWIILFVLCWPLALLALIAYPFVWLLLLPFRLIGITVDAVFDLLKTLLHLPARLLGGSAARA